MIKPWTQERESDDRDAVRGMSVSAVARHAEEHWAEIELHDALERIDELGVERDRLKVALIDLALKSRGPALGGTDTLAAAVIFSAILTATRDECVAMEVGDAFDLLTQQSCCVVAAMRAQLGSTPPAKDEGKPA